MGTSNVMKRQKDCRLEFKLQTSKNRLTITSFNSKEKGQTELLMIKVKKVTQDQIKIIIHIPKINFKCRQKLKNVSTMSMN